MNKKQLIDAVADGAGVSRATAGRAVEVVLETVAARLAAGESVMIPGFGDVRGARAFGSNGAKPADGRGDRHRGVPAYPRSRPARRYASA